MLAFGLVVAGVFDGRRFKAASGRQSFYTELKPISDRFDPKAVEVTGLDRVRLATDAPSPAEAMTKAAEWVRAVSAGHNPVIVGYPLVYDWLFLYWYFEQFAAGGAPFGFSSGLDMKTMYQQKARVVLSQANRRDLPPAVRSNREHTHNALDDALEQAEIFVRLFEWPGGTAPTDVSDPDRPLASS
jgi:DNA polymerase III epsilon subunit-like protein